MSEQKEVRKEFEKWSEKEKGIDVTSAHKTVGMTPNVLEERELNVAQMDVFSRLMMDRVLFLGMPINDTVANIIMAQLLFLESTNKGAPIHIYINSPGGQVYSGNGIMDTMNHIESPVATTAAGMAASMGAVLLAAGEEGMRSALPHSRVMIHQPLGGTQGQASDIQITAKEIEKIKEELCQVISNRTGNSYDKVYQDVDRDYWLRADEAKEYGIIDEVLSSNNE